ncbi:Uncharacterised protein [Serratia entomophila]|uniref:hypothetical protein n=1 Tax=Serratia entomophila TaxID=42906 RepID=UPI00217C7B95|nr:hypothetical protein [Serratia entomophila]CAI0767824.1 Uncharacterised protein [Serratia entomophila]CAI1601308.1 Uncharacterised protein [Serratia entomophila]CAI1606347.1 Uncharacterised protein [Serratia entomophila]CAI1954693.1 Uncharacterised protein [Serratia entomophila]CAI2051169.1 Uncharacterised protein [Serratia entomophila]
MPISIGRGIILPGDNYQRVSEISSPLMTPPDTTGLIGAYFPGVLAKKGELYNYANSAKPLKKVGKPDLFGSFARCDSDNCFDTDIKVGTNTTMYVIARTPTAGATAVDRGLAISDWSEGPSRGVALELRTTADGLQAFGYLTPERVGSVQVQTENRQGFNIFLFAHKDGAYAGVGIYEPSLRKFKVSNFKADVLVPTGRNILFGGHYSEVEFLGKQDIAGALIYEGVTHNYDNIGNYLWDFMMPQSGMR